MRTRPRFWLLIAAALTAQPAHATIPLLDLVDLVFPGAAQREAVRRVMEERLLAGSRGAATGHRPGDEKVAAAFRRLLGDGETRGLRRAVELSRASQTAFEREHAGLAEELRELGLDEQRVALFLSVSQVEHLSRDPRFRMLDVRWPRLAPNAPLSEAQVADLTRFVRTCATAMRRARRALDDSMHRAADEPAPLPMEWFTPGEIERWSPQEQIDAALLRSLDAQVGGNPLWPLDSWRGLTRLLPFADGSRAAFATLTIKEGDRRAARELLATALEARRHAVSRRYGAGTTAERRLQQSREKLARLVRRTGVDAAKDGRTARDVAGEEWAAAMFPLRARSPDLADRTFVGLPADPERLEHLSTWLDLAVDREAMRDGRRAIESALLRRWRTELIGRGPEPDPRGGRWNVGSPIGLGTDAAAAVREFWRATAHLEREVLGGTDARPPDPGPGRNFILHAWLEAERCRFGLDPVHRHGWNEAARIDLRDRRGRSNLVEVLAKHGVAPGCIVDHGRAAIHEWLGALVRLRESRLRAWELRVEFEAEIAARPSDDLDRWRRRMGRLQTGVQQAEDAVRHDRRRLGAAAESLLRELEHGCPEFAAQLDAVAQSVRRQRTTVAAIRQGDESARRLVRRLRASGRDSDALDLLEKDGLIRADLVTLVEEWNRSWHAAAEDHDLGRIENRFLARAEDRRRLIRINDR